MPPKPLRQETRYPGVDAAGAPPPGRAESPPGRPAENFQFDF